MRLRALLLACIAVAGGCLSAVAADAPTAPAPDELLRAVSREHPRLLARQADFDSLKGKLASPGLLAEWWAKLRQEARDLEDLPVSNYEIPDGLRLLSTSRRVLDRAYTLGLAWRLEGDRRYADRLWRELAAAAAFPDWNPRHFLDTAEMTHAFAIGYDWVYDAWTPEQRETLRRAMVDKGLRPGLECYRGASRFGWWTTSEHNWNQVCNGGLGMGALALAEVEPALVGELLHSALVSLPRALRSYAPDGAWGEGPGYWNYATSYTVGFLAALRSACGREYGLADIEGVSETGLFPLHVTGPLGRTFNYADGGDGAIRSPCLFWLATRFGRPACAGYELRWAHPEPLDVIWGAASPHSPAAAGLPLGRHFRRADVVTMRSAWDDPQALFLGCKAGDNRVNHSHLDLGSFVFDASGVRWAEDLGADDYNLPGYFGNQRWTYYRLRAEGHNTLVLNPGAGPDQDPQAAARVLKFAESPGQIQAVFDLSPAYAAHARRVARGFALLGGRRLWIQDELEAERPCDAWWFLHTRAEVEVSADGRWARLRQGQTLFEARIETGEGRFEVLLAAPLSGSPVPPKQAVNRGVRKLAIHYPEARRWTLAVSLSAPADKSEGARIRPLSEW